MKTKKTVEEYDAEINPLMRELDMMRKRDETGDEYGKLLAKLSKLTGERLEAAGLVVVKA